jgi:hypothetical protein
LTSQLSLSAHEARERLILGLCQFLGSSTRTGTASLTADECRG